MSRKKRRSKGKSAVPPSSSAAPASTTTAKKLFLKRTRRIAVHTQPETNVSRKDKQNIRKGLGRGTVSIGRTGLEFSGDEVDEEFHKKLRGRRGVKVYREMRDNDAVIGSSINLIVWMLRQVTWRMEPADDSQAAQDAMEFGKEVMADMENTWEETLSEIVSFIWFGWSYFEKVYKFRNGKKSNKKESSKYNDGKIGLRGMFIRSQESLDGWDFDDDGCINGMYQVAAPNYVRTFLPLEKCVLFRTEIYKNNPEGRSMLRNVFRSWWFLKRMQEIEAIGIERDLVGMPVLELPLPYLEPSAPDDIKTVYEDMKLMVQQIRRNEHEGLVVPASVDEEGNPTGFKLSLMSTGGSRQIDPGAVVTRYEKREAMVLLTQFLFLGMDKAGSFALSSDQTNLFATALGGILDIIKDTFNADALDEVMELNGIPEDVRPKWVPGDIEKENVDQFASAMQKLAQGGFITPDDPLEEHLREKMGVPPMDEATRRDASMEDDVNALNEELNAQDEEKDVQDDDDDEE